MSYEMGEITLNSKDIFAAVQPIKKDLETIKSQLNKIGTTLEDLRNRVEEIEQLVKGRYDI